MEEGLQYGKIVLVPDEVEGAIRRAEETGGI